ncbi:metallophosphoesterase family protein [Tissierella sp. Yu-01]|uniref:metallophosphoesterase family protein n=1 Tax=Tissierella sp. Yu-01 TaxID=3035694 RepID=UPI00240E38A5|nr:metallophosphoesterase family protein [Tissierella sp. Yu-01]WFA10186.1 metallophosphoesterase family protein [Tissierella sp. Yu-01]
MKIGIISDTHISKDSYLIKHILDTYFKDVDMIIHAGDYINENVIKIIRDYKDFIGVHGNVDNDNVKELLKEKEIITLEGYRIGIFHGHGNEGATLTRAFNSFKDDNVDIIIFGHSHQPLVKTEKGILMLNPGSITTKRFERWFSYIILELKTDGIKVNLEFIPPSNS